MTTTADTIKLSLASLKAAAIARRLSSGAAF